MLCILFCKGQSSVDHSYVNKEELQFQQFHLLRNILNINSDFFKESSLLRDTINIFLVFTVKYSSVVTCISGLFCYCVLNWLYYKKHSCWDFSPAESWGLWIVESCKGFDLKFPKESFQNLITTIQINTLLNLEQVCQNFSLALLDPIKYMSVRYLSHKFKITKVAKIKLSVQCQ